MEMNEFEMVNESFPLLWAECVFASVNENPLKIASSCIRVKLSVCHTATRPHVLPLILRCLRKRTTVTTRGFSPLLLCLPPSLPSWVLCAPSTSIRLFVPSSSLSHHHIMCLSPSIRPTPSRLACQTSSILCGIEILDEIAPSSCKCTH